MRAKPPCLLASWRYCKFWRYAAVRQLQLLSTGGSPPGDAAARRTSASDADRLRLSKKQNVLGKKKRLNQPRWDAVHIPSVGSYSWAPAAKTLEQMCSVLQHYFIILKHNYYFRTTTVVRMASTSNLGLRVLAASGRVLLVQNIHAI